MRALFILQEITPFYRRTYKNDKKGAMFMDYKSKILLLAIVMNHGKPEPRDITSQLIDLNYDDFCESLLELQRERFVEGGTVKTPDGKYGSVTQVKITHEGLEKARIIIGEIDKEL